MKILKKLTLYFCTFIIVLTATRGSLYANEKTADFSIPNSREYVPTQGTHLMLKLTGIDENKNTVLSMGYMEFPIQEGEVLTKKHLLELAQRVADNTEYRKFKVKDFEEGSKVEFNFPGNETAFPITDEGFKLPDYSKVVENPEFILVTNVILEKIEFKPYVLPNVEEIIGGKPNSKLYGTNEVDVYHDVIFLKREGKSIIPASIKTETQFPMNHRKNDKISENDLFNYALKEFEKTKEYKEGYKLIKRLSTVVLEDEVEKREIYNFDENKPFEYIINPLREPNSHHHDVVTEQYYISKNGDDYVIDMERIVIEYVNENGLVIGTKRFKGFPFKSSDEVANYLTSMQIDEITSKDGKDYKFSGKVDEIGKNRYQAKFYCLNGTALEKNGFDISILGALDVNETKTIFKDEKTEIEIVNSKDKDISETKKDNLKTKDDKVQSETDREIKKIKKLKAESQKVKLAKTGVSSNTLVFATILLISICGLFIRKKVRK
ncbi:MAG: LPXTG cell wall anchor domain-containing protein [Peptoniphilaceae bacterium]|uniref:LPXTG cell wall anchor domain-containing protein n=1 Tax=Parvimonas sp. TaxID=1944660 RepID=UPI002A763726|nr:LPXTG cell wall anchor domain-containing protein [Parvimonas sp.]MDD7764571.1 LPXTG cell wall anchor domain-containing protein [Peptoniphilaceae bacterium]MDY3050549.1 LPXTG cell wall anchor domain-containing protein [Parvimonas sp.]